MSTELAYTPMEDIPQIHETLKQTFLSGKTRPEPYRKEQLLQIAYLLQENDAALCEAVKKDLGRPIAETSSLEISTMVNSSVNAIKNLHKWMKPETPSFDINFSPLSPKIRKESKGIALIIGPFNFPIWCSISPLIGAVSAGCPAVLKMPELCPAISSLMAELFSKYLDPAAYRVVNGGIAETTKLLDLRWDQIFYTGSGRVGRIVAAAAAKNVTPVALELGGKSPVIIDPGYQDLDVGCRRVLWGKFSNAGQICLAPDYVLCPAERQDEVVAVLTKIYNKFYPDGPEASDSFGRLVSQTAFERVAGMLSRTKGDIVCGGSTDASQKYIAPTIVKNVKLDDSLMESEIFGPILPIVPVASLQDAVDFVKQGDAPLVIYALSTDKKTKNYILENTRSGGVMFNDVVIHVGSDLMPFGGTGESGYGSHLGKASFDTFTHFRSTADSPRWLDLILAARFPPYDLKKSRRTEALVRKSIPYPKPGTTPSLAQKAWARYMGVGIIVALAAYAARWLRKGPSGGASQKS